MLAQRKLHHRFATRLCAVLLMGAIAAPWPAAAHSTHRECKETSDGRHRHAPSGELVPCAADTLQDPFETRSTRSAPAERDAVSTDPGRDAVGAPDTTTPAAPQRATPETSQRAAPQRATAPAGREPYGAARTGTAAPAGDRRRN